jgi:hypothetical protein
LTEGGGEVTALEFFEDEVVSNPFPDKCGCNGGAPLESDSLGSPDRGCGGGLDRSARELKGGGRLRSRCGCMMTSFSGVAELGELGGSAAWFARELVKALS